MPHIIVQTTIVIVGFFIPVTSLKVLGHTILSERFYDERIVHQTSIFCTLMVMRGYDLSVMNRTQRVSMELGEAEYKSVYSMPRTPNISY